MSTSGNSHKSEPNRPSRKAVLLLLADMADTTWRMFGPVILFVALGIWADDRYTTGPWLSLAGVLIGSLLAALLIKKQLSRVTTQP
ncbi:AtpZ/AtpI family protein [Candidatus Saccharibacteria bacterium]|nr:AtpZ/AtpI family protein [Candidatus Saccharibacteria bacterium]